VQTWKELLLTAIAAARAATAGAEECHAANTHDIPREFCVDSSPDRHAVAEGGFDRWPRPPLRQLARRRAAVES